MLKLPKHNKTRGQTPCMYTLYTAVTVVLLCPEIPIILLNRFHNPAISKDQTPTVFSVIKIVLLYSLYTVKRKPNKNK